TGKRCASLMCGTRPPRRWPRWRGPELRGLRSAPALAGTPQTLFHNTPQPAAAKKLVAGHPKHLVAGLSPVRKWQSVGGRAGYPALQETTNSLTICFGNLLTIRAPGPDRTDRSIFLKRNEVRTGRRSARARRCAWPSSRSAPA